MPGIDSEILPVDFVEISLGLIFFSVEPVGESVELHESSFTSEFGSRLNSFSTVFLDGGLAFWVRVASLNTMPGIDSNILPVDFVEFSGDLVFSIVDPVGESVEVLELHWNSGEINCWNNGGSISNHGVWEMIHLDLHFAT
jgi:hypothetical protein